MSDWDSKDTGEPKGDESWSTTSAAAPEQPTPEHRVDESTFVKNDGAVPDTTLAEPGANPDWAAQGRTQYDYENYNDRGGEYDGNARVYHWSGDEGDIGPEFPELEAELFGPPEKRDLPQGIDFSR